MLDTTLAWCQVKLKENEILVVIDRNSDRYGFANATAISLDAHGNLWVCGNEDDPIFGGLFAAGSWREARVFIDKDGKYTATEESDSPALLEASQD